jgi:ubiquinone/menaquinone biosynthesis C-methylase UbiE
MKVLEREPSTYEAGFTALTKGVNLQVQDWIVGRVQGGNAVLEVGCGPGAFARKLAQNGCLVTAIDSNPKMIEQAKTSVPPAGTPPITFQQGTAQTLPAREGGYDNVVSTFLLSELGPLAQQLFLRAAWGVMKPGGMLYIAEEFVPNGIRRFAFAIKRWWYLRKLKRHRTGVTHPLANFESYLKPMGFEVVAEQDWAGGAIRALALRKVGDQAGYYRPPPCKVTGVGAWVRVARCLLTGQIDHVPIEPGLYASGTPTPTSPVIVTANYYYTLFCVLRDLRGVDAWVLCVDSRGINVWCAARGPDFGNAQLVEAVNASGLSQVVSHFKLILPQLSAGGVALPTLPADFKYHVFYGPVWSRDLPEYLQEQVVRKPERMRVIHFTIAKRIQAGITHGSFLLRKFMFWPSILLLALFLGFQWWDGVAILGWAWITVVSTALFLAILFPVANRWRSFTKKSIFFGVLGAIICAIALLLVQAFTPTFPGWVVLQFWLGYFATMSFSGYTMESSPRAIQGEYPAFMRWNWRVLAIALTLIVLGALWDVII